MKSLLVTLGAVLLAGSAFAQAGLSPRTRIFLSRQDDRKLRQPGYIYRSDASGATVLPALLQIRDNVAEEDLKKLGVSIATKAGSVWTAAIPPARLAAVAALKSIGYIELDEPVFSTMDSARRKTHVDSVHAGWGLPKGFSGAGVVVGVLDVGFDYTHPAFRDTSGTRYRIRRVWEQRATTGTPPAAFGYGRELTDSVLIQAAGSDNKGQSHGSHVAGIAAGSGRGAGAADSIARRNRGMAYASDIVLVGITPPSSDWTSTGMSDIINGMKYVYDYAAANGRPAVVNLSWGCSIGSHDGRSLFSQACNALTGPGKLFVLSAGNNGQNNLHLEKAFNAADTVVHTFVNFPATPVGRRSWFDAWGDSAQRLSVRLSLYNGATRTDSSAWISLGSAVQNVLLRGSAGDTLTASVSASIATFNNKPHILLDLESRSADRLCISIRGTGTVHAWLGYVYGSTGYYGDLNNGSTNWAMNGGSFAVLGDMATTDKAIAVGAYASRSIYTNINGTKQDYSNYAPDGRLVPFSSKGPTVDGRIKPDITGPGLWLASSVNSFDTSFGPGGGSRENVVSEWTPPGQSHPYQYAALTGTSMSSPAVAGITALLLEAAPRLSPDSLHNILTGTAIQEFFMGNLPNASWGAGKVNAYAALQRLMSSLGVSEVVSNPASLDLLLYPNPSSGNVTLEHRSDRGGPASIAISDATGKIIRRESWQLNAGANNKTMSWTDMPQGIYFVRLETAAGKAMLKVAVQ
jgi:minor extracellular serine protease Vpr